MPGDSAWTATYVAQAQPVRCKKRSIRFCLCQFHTGSGAVILTLTSPVALMSALLETLRYQPHGLSQPSTTMEEGNTESKFGIPRFDGNPHHLPEYVYRVQTRIAREKAMTEDEVKKLGPLGLRLVEGLRGQAFRLAQQVDLSTLSSERGAEVLLKTFNDNLKPRKAQEARELYAAGSREGGLLSRQSGEPMSSYVSRRRAWWSALQGLDSNLKIPDMILAEQILTNCGLTDDQKLMIRTVLQGTFNVDKVCEELLSQHPHIHDRERGRGHGFHGGKGKGKPWKKNPWKSGFSRGYHAETEADEEEWDTSSQSLTGYTAAYETENEYQDDELYGYEAQHYESWSEENEDDFLVMSFAMLSDGGLDLQSEEACAYAAECFQLEHEAYLVRHKGKGKGFNGFGQQRQFDITGSVSFQERKARLAQLKAKTECRRWTEGPLERRCILPKGCNSWFYLPISQGLFWTSTNIDIREFWQGQGCKTSCGLLLNGKPPG